MSNQPYSLRLADELAAWEFSSSGLCGKAAAELRRLHENFEAAKVVGIRQEEEIMRLEALNAQLLEALKLAQQCLSGSDDPTLLPRTCKAVDTAIAKAES